MKDVKGDLLILPNLLIIGAQKAATTAIYLLLKNHPDAYMAELKEIAFFTTDYKYRQGLKYYSSHFLGWKGEKVVGEATPGYLHKPAAPERIFKAIPDIKLIVSLRDPIDRAYSAYVMQLTKGSEHPAISFQEAIDLSPEYIEYGRYIKHLNRYLEFFSLRQICILIYEELQTNPQQFYDKIFDFLKIDRLKISQVDIPKSNVGGISKRLWIQQSLHMSYKFRNYLKDSFLNWIVTNSYIDIVSRKIRNQIAGWNRERGNYPKLNSEIREKLLPQVRDYNNALEEKFHIDVSRWNKADPY
jgi:hypothetical protein